MVLILLLYMLSAITFTLAKAALYYASPFFFIGIRMVIAGSLLLTYLYFFHSLSLRFDKSDWRSFLSITFFHIYGAYGLEFLGLRTLSSAKSCLLYNLIPFMTVILSYYTFDERITRMQWLAIIVGFIGLLPLSLATGDLTSSLWTFSLPEILILLSAACAAQGWVTMRKLVSYRHYSPLFVNGFGMITGGLLALITSLCIEQRPFIFTDRIIGSFPLEQWLHTSIHSNVGMFIFYMVMLIIIANFIVYNMYGWLLKYYSATYISFVGFTCPLFAALYGSFFLEEEITLSFFVSAAIVCFGLGIFYWDEQTQKT